MDNFFLGGIFFAFLGIAGLLVYFQMRTNKSISESMIQCLAFAQNKLFSDAAELLATHLTEYTNTILMDKVSENYKMLISEQLLPQVNEAAQSINDMAAGVYRSQQEGLKELAGELASLLASRTHEYIEEEAQVIDNLNENVKAFSKELYAVTETAGRLAEMQSGTNSQIKAAYDNIVAAGNIMGDRISELSVIMNNTNEAMVSIQSLVNESNATVESLIGTTQTVEQAMAASAKDLSDINAATAKAITDSVSDMQVNTEATAEAMVRKFADAMAERTAELNQTVEKVGTLAGSIGDSSEKFLSGMDNMYASFGESLHNALNDITDDVAKAVGNQYEKVVAGAAEYSDNFVNSVGQLSLGLQEHISGLSGVTADLNSSIVNYKKQVEASAENFEKDMENSIENALVQIDSSLAEIVSRLVTVTVNIQDAADSLPKAVNALKAEAK